MAAGTKLLMSHQIDHIAIGASSLEAGTAYLHDRLGIEIPAGGKHDMMGTHNCLMSLGGACYFELISIDDAAPAPHRPRWFSLDERDTQNMLAERPRALCWIVATDDLDRLAAQSPVGLGEILELRRDNLRWRLTVPQQGNLLMDGLIPFFIEWPEDMHPSRNMADLGIRLEAVQLTHPDPELLMTYLRALEVDHLCTVSQAEPSVSFALSTPGGIVILD